MQHCHCLLNAGRGRRGQGGGARSAAGRGRPRGSARGSGPAAAAKKRKMVTWLGTCSFGTRMHEMSAACLGQHVQHLHFQSTQYVAGCAGHGVPASAMLAREGYMHALKHMYDEPLFAYQWSVHAALLSCMKEAKAQRAAHVGLR